MIPDKSYLQVNRLVVFSGPAAAYDQKFHVGLNIIRGDNSSGKSTVLDFIFYGLGGDVTVWKTAAAQCTQVVLEIEANGTKLTLSRVIRSEGKAPMEIFFGSFDDSSKFEFKNWSHHPYSSTSKTDGFSKVLFRALGYPEVKSDLNSLITMHQVLRLAYVDQVSRITSLMRDEDFDSPLTRETVAELMLGVYDDSLYAEQVNLRDRIKELEDITAQVIHTKDFLEAAGDDVDSAKLAETLSDYASELDGTNLSISTILSEVVSVRDTSMTETNDLREYIAKEKTVLADLNKSVETLEYDFDESETFIKTLEQRVAALSESLATRETLGEFPFCPLCNIPVKELEGKAMCEASGRAIRGDFGLSSTLRMREELMHQLHESRHLQSEREKSLTEKRSNRTLKETEIKRLSTTYNQKVRSVKTSRDNRLDGLYQRKGELEASLTYIAKLQKHADVLTFLLKRENQIRKFIIEIEARIAEKRSKQFSRKQAAMESITSCARAILVQDFKRQDEFLGATHIDLDFKRNTYFLDGQNNFSASSSAYLKNAIHFSVLFASTEDADFRYPRFILCDNVEDGGMEEGRSKNFQKIVADIASRVTPPFQIIFSTSMIAEELNNDQYCIGPYYTHKNRTLQLPASI